MISYISGIYAGHSTDAVVIECGGIGFCIRVPETVLNRLPAKNSEFKLYTYLHVKEDAMQLYGFISKEEQEMFDEENDCENNIKKAIYSIIVIS